MRFAAIVKTLFSTKPKGPLPPYGPHSLSATTMGSVPSSAASSGSSLALSGNNSSEELSPILYAVATASYTANASHEVNLIVGEQYTVLAHGQGPNSWSTVKSANLGGAVGRVPTAYLKIVVPKGRAATPETSRRSLPVVDEIAKLERANHSPGPHQLSAPPPAPAVDHRHQTGLCAFVEVDVKKVHDGQLEVERGELVLVLTQDGDWTYARTVGRLGHPGWVPTPSIRIVDPVSGQDIDSTPADMLPSLDKADCVISIQNVAADTTPTPADASSATYDHLAVPSGASDEAALVECSTVNSDEFSVDISSADISVVHHATHSAHTADPQAAEPIPARICEPKSASTTASSLPSTHPTADSDIAAQQDLAIQFANAPEPKPEDQAGMPTPETACTLHISEHDVSLLTSTGEADAAATVISSIIGDSEEYGGVEFPQPGEGQVVFRGYYSIPGENFLELERLWAGGETEPEGKEQVSCVSGRMGHYNGTQISAASSSAFGQSTPVCVASTMPAPPFPPLASRWWPKLAYTYRVLGDDCGEGNVLLPGRFHDLSAQGFHREGEDLWFHVSVQYTPSTSAGGDTPTYSFLLFRQYDEFCALHQELAALVPAATESTHLTRKRKNEVVPDILHHGWDGAGRDEEWAMGMSVLLSMWLAALGGLSFPGYSAVYSHPLVHEFLKPWSVDRIAQVPKGDEWAVAAGSDRGCWPEEQHPCKVRRVELGREEWHGTDTDVFPRRAQNHLLVEFPSTGEALTIAEPDNLTLQALLLLVDASFGDIGDGEFYALRRTFNGAYTPEGTRCLERWGTFQTDSQLKRWLDATSGEGGRRYIAVAPPVREEEAAAGEYADEGGDVSDRSADEG